MKRYKNLFIMLGVIAVLAVLIVVALNIDTEGETPDVTPSPTQQEFYYLRQKSQDEVKSVRIETGGESYTLVRSGSEYIAQEYPDAALSSALAGSIFSTASSVYGVELIADSAEDLSVYGLDKPEWIIDIQYTDGDSVRLLVGSVLPSGLAHYMKADDDPRILTMSYSHKLSYFKQLGELRTTPNLMTVADDFEYLQIDRNGELILETQLVEGDDKMGITTIEFTRPWRGGVHATNFLAMLESITEIGFAGLADPSPDDLGAYGLDEPALRAHYRTTGNEYILLLGDASTSHEGYHYAMIEGDDLVYYVDSSIYRAFDVNPYNLMDMLVLPIGIGNIDRFSFEGFGKSLSVDVEQIIKKDKDGNDLLDGTGSPMRSQIFRMGGVEMDETRSRYMYQYLIGVTADQPIAEGWEKPETPVATITYHRPDTNTEAELVFYEYDKDFYAIEQSGAVNFAVRKEKVQKIGSAVDEYRAGELQAP